MTSRTLFIARLLGLYLLCAAFTMFAHKQAAVNIESAIVHSPALLYLGGIITLVAGLAVVLGHNVWRGGALPVVVTLCGWMMVLKGVMLMLPNTTLEFWQAWRYEQLYYLYASIALALGAYLTISGFRETWHLRRPGHQH